LTGQWTEYDPDSPAVPPSGSHVPPLPSLPAPPADSTTAAQIQPELPTPRELLVQRMVGGALMLVLLSITGYLWNFDWLFRVLFTVYTGLSGYWFWDLFVRHPRT